MGSDLASEYPSPLLTCWQHGYLVIRTSIIQLWAPKFHCRPRLAAFHDRAMSPVSCDTFPPRWCTRKPTRSRASQNSMETLRGRSSWGLNRAERFTGAATTWTPEGNRRGAETRRQGAPAGTSGSSKRATTFVLFYFSQADRQEPETRPGEAEEPCWQREEQTRGELGEGPKARQSGGSGNSDFYPLHVFRIRLI